MFHKHNFVDVKTTATYDSAYVLLYCHISFLNHSHIIPVTQTRVTGQLYTYTDDEMKQKFGRDYAFTSPPPPPEQLPQMQSLEQLSKLKRHRYDSRTRVSTTKDKEISDGKNESPKANQPPRSPSKEKSPNRSKGKADEKAGTRKDQIKSATNRLQKPDEIQVSIVFDILLVHTYTSLQR